MFDSWFFTYVTFLSLHQYPGQRDGFAACPHGTTGVSCCRDCCLHGEWGTFRADSSCLHEFCSPCAWGVFQGNASSTWNLPGYSSCVRKPSLPNGKSCSAPGHNINPFLHWGRGPVGINSAHCTTALEAKTALGDKVFFQNGLAWVILSCKQYYNYIKNCTEEGVLNPDF